jgi:hypothetical protein
MLSLTVSQNSDQPLAEQIVAGVEKQRARWDLLLLGIEYHTEQLRQLKTFEPRKLLFTGLTTGAALFGAAVALAAFVLRLLHFA